jgi:predicted transcriptional regulator
MPEVEEPEITISISGVPPELVRKIDRLAEAEDRSRSAFIRRELEQAIERRKRENAALAK